MGVLNEEKETLRRPSSKTLDARFLNEIQNGLDCASLESEAVLDVVIGRAVYDLSSIFALRYM